jgi:hypothetical protein
LCGKRIRKNQDAPSFARRVQTSKRDAYCVVVLAVVQAVMKSAWATVALVARLAGTIAFEASSSVESSDPSAFVSAAFQSTSHSACDFATPVVCASAGVINVAIVSAAIASVRILMAPC